MPRTGVTLSELVASQRAFDAERSTTFEWSGAITAEQTQPLVHNALSLAGEAGEIANLVKKLDRGDFGFDHLMDELPGELADVMIYVIKIAYQSGIDLELALRQKMLSNSRRFPATNAPSQFARRMDHAIVDQAAKLAARLNDARLMELANIYSREGLAPPADADRLVVGALLALQVAKLADFEGSPAARQAAWERISPVAGWLPITYDSIVDLARHDIELSRLLSTPPAEAPAAS